MNKIGDNGLSTIAKTLEKSSTINFLSVGTNGITDQGAIELAKCIETNRGLLTVDIGDNDITNEGGKAFGKALEKNVVIDNLILSGKIFLYLK